MSLKSKPCAAPRSQSSTQKLSEMRLFLGKPVLFAHLFVGPARRSLVENDGLPLGGQEQVMMSDSSTYLAEYQEALAAQGIDPTPLEREAEALELLSGADLEQALKSFRASADRGPSIWDSDYGALLLETLGDKSATTERKVIFYEAAAIRAGDFTSGATAGGEALARKIDLDRIAGKLAALRTGQ